MEEDNDSSEDLASDRLNPLEDAFRDEIDDLKEKLLELDEVRRLAKDLDSVGMVKVQVDNYNMEHQPTDMTKLKLTGWVSSLCETGPRHEPPLAERIIMLEPENAQVDWDNRNSAFRVSTHLML